MSVPNLAFVTKNQKCKKKEKSKMWVSRDMGTPGPQRDRQCSQTVASVVAKGGHFDYRSHRTCLLRPIARSF